MSKRLDESEDRWCKKCDMKLPHDIFAEYALAYKAPAFSMGYNFYNRKRTAVCQRCGEETFLDEGRA